MGSLLRSTGIIAASTLASRVLGFLRDMLMAGFFGATGSTDAFYVAFRIPNLLRRLVAEGALTISFIPIYSEYLIREGEEESLRLAQKTLSILILVVTVIVTLGVFFSREIVFLFAFGFSDPGQIDLAVSLTRVMFPYLIFVAFVAFAMGVLNSHHYFFAPAFAPVLLNIGFIIGIVFLSSFFTEPLYGVSAGVILGGLFQGLIQVPYLIKSGFKMKVSFDFKHPGIRKIFRMITPALFGIAVYQINILMGTILASFLEDGSISYLYYSDRLTELILGVFIVSIGNVILPEMSQMSARNSYDKLRSLYVTSISSALFVAVPASIALMTVGFPVISVIFMRGEFSLYQARMTEMALFYSSIGITSVSVLRLTTPTFYSIKYTRTPVITAAVAFIINIALGYVLMKTPLKHSGLSLANSISVTVQMALLFIWLQKRIGRVDFKMLGVSVLRFVAAGAVMAAVIHYMSFLTDWGHSRLLSRAVTLRLIVLAGGSVYLLICYVTGSGEVRFLVDIIRKKMRRQ